MACADQVDKLICSFCSSISEELTRLRCGHYFCRECMEVVPDALKRSGDHTCPGCRAELQERPVPSNLGNEIFCSDCTFSPLPAVISCLNCEASLCDNHLKVHIKSEEHVFTKLNFTRSTPKKAFMNYCNEDAACICVTCSLSEEHQGHQVETLTEVSDHKENLRNVIEKLAKNKESTEERVKDLQNALRGTQERSAGVKERIVAWFKDTRRKMDALENKILKDIANQEEQARTSVCELIRELETKIAQLARDIEETEELCTKTGPLPVVQSWESILHDTGNMETLDQDKSGLDVGLIAATLHTSLTDIITGMKRAFYVPQTPDIVLNMNTASNDLHITADLKSASGSELKQNRPKLPERFQYNQVLSVRSFSSGRHFLEVETCLSGNWRLGMSSASIARKGYHSLIGHSNKSWGLCRYLNQYLVIHNRKVIPVPHKPSSQRLGIFLDYEAGRIGFYELCDPIRHLYTYTTTFNEALHLILGVYTGWVRIRN